MEFNYRDGQNRRTTSPWLRHLSTDAYVFRCPLRGGFSDNVRVPSVFPTRVQINAEEAFQRELEIKHTQRELEKEEIRKRIIAYVRRQKLEEEVRREMVSHRAFELSMQRSEGNLFNNNYYYNMSGGSQFQLPIDNKQASEQINKKDKVIQGARPNVDSRDGKRKAMTFAGDDNESLEKKVKQEWSCEFCQITTTSEKGLNEHIQGKKHKAKASRRTQKIGLDSRLEGQTLPPCNSIGNCHVEP